MNTIVNFEIAKLLKGKGYENYCINFYTKPNSKMFGVDTEGRTYPIKNTPKKLYTVGEHLALNIKNVYLAPTIADVIMWIYEKHGIQLFLDFTYYDGFHYGIKWIKSNGDYGEIWRDNNGETPYGYDSWSEAYLEAIKYVLTVLI